jgi:hypothetical protein
VNIYNADGGSVDIQKVVGETVPFLEGEFAHRDALRHCKIGEIARLDRPSG